MRNLFGHLALQYARHTPNHRGRVRMLHLIDQSFGPFDLVNPEGIHLQVYVGSLLDRSFFNPPAKITGENDRSGTTAIDTHEVALSQVNALKEGELFVDIGANIGYLSLLASKKVGPRGLVVSVEPSIREYARLLSNISRNHAQNLIPIHGALGEMPGVFHLEISSGFNTGINRLSLKSTDEGLTSNYTRKYPVPVFTGDSFLGTLLGERKVSLMKIDVEGAELMVLKGLSGFFRERGPAKVIMEITPEFFKRMGYVKEEVYSFMSLQGYRPRYCGDHEQYDELFSKEC